MKTKKKPTVRHLNDLETIRKNQILFATLKKISETGSSIVTLSDIAREAGLSKGGLIHYFPSKEALCKEAFKSFFERIFQRSLETMDGCKDPMQKLLSFGWLYNWEDPDVNLGYPLLFDSMAMASRDGDYRAMFHEGIRNWIDMLRGAIEECQGQGRFKGCDPECMAKTISAIYHGIAVRWYLDKKSHPTDWAVKSAKNVITSLLNSYD